MADKSKLDQAFLRAYGCLKGARKEAFGLKDRYWSRGDPPKAWVFLVSELKKLRTRLNEIERLLGRDPDAGRPAPANGDGPDGDQVDTTTGEVLVESEASGDDRLARLEATLARQGELLEALAERVVAGDDNGAGTQG